MTTVARQRCCFDVVYVCACVHVCAAQKIQLARARALAHTHTHTRYTRIHVLYIPPYSSMRASPPISTSSACERAHTCIHTHTCVPTPYNDYFYLPDDWSLGRLSLRSAFAKRAGPARDSGFRKLYIKYIKPTYITLISLLSFKHYRLSAKLCIMCTWIFCEREGEREK